MKPESNAISCPFFELVRALVLNRDAPGTIFAFWNCSLECPEFQVMILDLNRQTFHAGFFGYAFWDSPTLEHSIFFDAEVKVMASGVMFLDNKSP